MVCTGKFLLALITMVMGVGLAVITIRSRGERVNESRIVVQPMIGGSNTLREGPWPECLGEQGDECKKLIEAYAEDVRGNVEIIQQDYMVTDDFVTTRVRIWVDEDGYVIDIPSRG